MLSYPRQQQYRRLARTGLASAISAVALLLAMLAAAGGVPQVAGLLVLAAVGLGLHARHWARLAARASIGARSEDQVQRALAPLDAEGWRLRHSLPWQGHGDIDSIAIAPTGIAFAIDTKTRTYTPEQLAHVRDTTAWLQQRRRRWCRNGALPVLCVVRDRGIERVETGVLVVSIDPPPRRAANGGRHPATTSIPRPPSTRRGDRLSPPRDSRSSGAEGRFPVPPGGGSRHKLCEHSELERKSRPGVASRRWHRRP